jgi:ABC-type Zn uptake system ZnuABC Zn-binding protein ZnuA
MQPRTKCISISKTAILHLLAGLVGAALVGCGESGQGRTPSPDRPKVVATHSVLGDWVRRVAGDDADVRVLVGPGQDAHTFQPTPDDAAALAGATLVFENGLGFEGWLDKAVAAGGGKAERVVVADGITPRTAECCRDHGDGEAGREETDPHIWHDVVHARHAVGRIRDALVRLDPARAEGYRSRAEAYLAELGELDAWVRGRVEALPKERRKLFTSHDTFGYFADRYGFEVAGDAFGSLSTEVGDPSAADIARLIKAIRASGVPAVFAENVSNPKLMERVAAEAGVRLAPTLYTDALGEPGSPGETYVGMVRHNVTVLTEALRP